MSKSLQYLKVLEAMKTANGPVTVSAIKAIDGIVAGRLSTYLWEIKKYTGCSVISNRDGRTVVSYELIDSGVVPTPKLKVAKVAKPKVAKAVKPKVAKVAKPKVAKPKVAKAVKPKVAKVAKVVKPKVAKVVKDDLIGMRGAYAKDSTIFDALSEIESSVREFEDRSFAQDYVRTL